MFRLVSLMVGVEAEREAQGWNQRPLWAELEFIMPFRDYMWPEKDGDLFCMKEIFKFNFCLDH